MSENETAVDVFGEARKEYRKGRSTAPKVEQEQEQLVRSSAERPHNRRRRASSMATPNARFVAPEIPGFHLCYVNEDQVDFFKERGYEFVDSKMTRTVGDGEESGLGSVKSIQAGRYDNGQPYKAYLMALPEEWWNEDQEELRQRNSMITDAIRRGKTSDAAIRVNKVKIDT